MPGAMGESFKCLLLTRDCSVVAARFAPQDLRRQL
jgi:hypothetical protein